MDMWHASRRYSKEHVGGKVGIGVGRRRTLPHGPVAFEREFEWDTDVSDSRSWGKAYNSRLR